jgi:hypothetical protein
MHRPFIKHWAFIKSVHLSAFGLALSYLGSGLSKIEIKQKSLQGYQKPVFSNVIASRKLQFKLHDTIKTPLYTP